jgi:tetratricopeptide (TPR) repeat protein
VSDAPLTPGDEPVNPELAALEERARAKPEDAWGWVALADRARELGEGERALEAYRTAEQAARRSSRERDLAAIRNRLGAMHLALGDPRLALLSYQAALTGFEAMSWRDPASQQRRDERVTAHRRVGEVRLMLGERNQALGEFRSSLLLAEELSREDPAETKWVRDRLLAQCHISALALGKGEREPALAAARSAVMLGRQLVDSDHSEQQWKRELAQAHELVGEALAALGEWQEALGAWRAALDARRAIAGNAVSGEDALAVIHVRARLTEVHVALRDFDGARAVAEAALAGQRALAEHEPDNRAARLELGRAHAHLADVLLAAGATPAALAEAKAGLGIAEEFARDRRYGRDGRELLAAISLQMGDALSALGQGRIAAALYQAAMAVTDTLLTADPDDPGLRRDMVTACLKVAETEPAQARAALARAEILAGALGEEGLLGPADADLEATIAQRLSDVRAAAGQ